jgi:hypothetical protein
LQAGCRRFDSCQLHLYMAKKIISFYKFSDLNKVPAERIYFLDGPMKGFVAGLKIDKKEYNAWYDKEKTVWPYSGFCEKIVVRVSRTDNHLQSIRPLVRENKTEENSKFYLYVLIDGGYKLEGVLGAKDYDS